MHGILTPIAGALLLSGITISWIHFDSNIYPYSITQPSSFRHLVLPTASDQKIDYFFPSLGSTTTNVNISATRGNAAVDVRQYLRSVEGTHVRKVGWLRIMGRNLTLTRADFKGYFGRYAEEQVSFTAGGYAWRLTASYDLRYSNLRNTMLRMIRSFTVH